MWWEMTRVLLAVLCLAVTAHANMAKLFGLLDLNSNGKLDEEEARVLIALNFVRRCRCARAPAISKPLTRHATQDVEPSEVPDEVLRGGKHGAMDADGKNFVGVDIQKFSDLLEGADAEAFEEVLAAASARQDL